MAAERVVLRRGLSSRTRAKSGEGLSIAGWYLSRPEFLSRCQRLFEICEQVVDVLDPTTAAPCPR